MKMALIDTELLRALHALIKLPPGRDAYTLTAPLPPTSPEKQIANFRRQATAYKMHRDLDRYGDL